MATPAVESPTKATKKPPKLFSVTGDATGIKTVLSSYSIDKLWNASGILAALSKVPEQFPGADTLSKSIDEFIRNPTAKPKP